MRRVTETITLVVSASRPARVRPEVPLRRGPLSTDCLSLGNLAWR